ncbi:MAG: hypothetical protein KBA02_00070 [Paludibacteraceae bacterium]|nr:hypothetical protein [Paludibacteraceae bacterium]
MEADAGFLKELKNYDKNLSAEWDRDRGLWAIKRKDHKGQVHHIFFVQNEDGSYRPLDNRVLEELYECDIWKHFKDAKEYHKFLQERNKQVKLKEQNLRKEYLEWFHKDNKKEWQDAIDNAKKGIL